MKARGVHLQYRFEAEGQRGAEVRNPLFELLSAIAENGSIQQAAHALGASYRHVWGECRRWEEELGEPLLLWELGQAESQTAAVLGRALRLDAGYLSRLLARLQERGLIGREADEADARVQRIALTRRGRTAHAALDRASREQLQQQTAHLQPSDRRELLGAMGTIERLLRTPDEREDEPLVLRDPRPGDMGWVVHRQALLYAQEYGWDAGFEALVSEIVARFVQQFDARRERCWIAERAHRIVGSIFLVRESDTEAKLRLLYVEAEARGLGVGARLVDECIRDARAKGYRRLTLWTNDVLTAARRIYQARGFQLVEEEPHHSFGHDLVGQYWALDL